MEKIKRTRIVDLLKTPAFGTTVNAKGWVRTRRGNKNVNFIALNDGSTINNLQIVVDLANFSEDLLKDITTGACLSVNGLLVESMGSGQAAEVQATEIEILGLCDNTYPLQKKGHSMEFLRDIAHLRPRTLAENTLVYFDHDNSKIHQYDLDLNELNACTTEYPMKSDWKPRIFQDESNNRFYTVVGYWLHEIDIKTGKTIPKIRIDVDIFSKVTLWHSHLFILKRQQMSTGKVQSYIERIDIDK